MEQLGGPEGKHCSGGQGEDATFLSSVSPWFSPFYYIISLFVLSHSKIIELESWFLKSFSRNLPPRKSPHSLSKDRSMKTTSFFSSLAEECQTRRSVTQEHWTAVEEVANAWSR